MKKEIEKEIQKLIDYGDNRDYFKQDILKAELKGFQQGSFSKEKEVLKIIKKLSNKKESILTDTGYYISADKLKQKIQNGTSKV